MTFDDWFADTQPPEGVEEATDLTPYRWAKAAWDAALAQQAQPGCKHDGGRDHYSDTHSRCWKCHTLISYGVGPDIIALEARADRAEAALARVQAFIDYPYRDGELTPEQYGKVSKALRAIIADEPKLEIVPPYSQVARWPDGSIAAPMENGGNYVTNHDGFIVGINGPVQMMTREQIRERFPNVKLPECCEHGQPAAHGTSTEWRDGTQCNGPVTEREIETLISRYRGLPLNRDRLNAMEFRELKPTISRNNPYLKSAVGGLFMFLAVIALIILSFALSLTLAWVGEHVDAIFK